ncbi:T9SS type A sorting domain-containing protein [Emticicia sp. C21]|uniref:T9SS type A sorting domain-containing protein n=1 Tax=Emticicia sp. C21 TaxID=2302915 RepID=UPI000E346DEF|nr:T9SS type A sorting domain-containing protein [Emticicia sp. C21]RFS17787.1 T9SS C-terminal target domain-containing protein [Emticicia sp. C21]
MKRLLTFACWLLGYTAVAQQQVSKFENRGFETPNKAQKVDTINGKLVFTINRPEIDGHKLWITDGKPENTHLLKDEEDNAVEAYPYTAKAYGYLYLKYSGSYLYRTKGDFLEKVLSRPDSLYSYHNFNGKLLLYFTNKGSYSPYYPGKPLYANLIWLNADNTITHLADNVLDFQIIDSTLHYTRTDYQSGNIELYKLNKYGQLTKNLLVANNSKMFIGTFRYYAIDGYDFYFFFTGNGRKLIVKPSNSNETLPFIDWGDNSELPMVVRDTLGQVYFLKQSEKLEIFALQNNHTLKKKWTVPIESQLNKKPEDYSPFILYRNFRIIGDELVFNSAASTISNLSFNLHVYNLKSGYMKRSKNLVAYLLDSPVTINSCKTDTSVFTIDNNINRKITYSFSKDTVTNLKDYPYENPQLKDTLISINHNTLYIKDNIYTVTNGLKTSLFPTRKIFDPTYPTDFSYRILGDKIIYLLTSPLTGKREIWASKGEKNEATMILSDSGYANYINNWAMGANGKFYFYLNSPQNQKVFYESDGTEAGTQKIYKSTEVLNVNPWLTRVNEKSVVFELRNTHNELKLLVIDNGNARLIDFPVSNSMEIYQTKTETYVYATVYKKNNWIKELYKVEGIEARLIDRNIRDLNVYKNRIFYSKTIGTGIDKFGLFTVDANARPLKFLNQNMYYYTIVEDKLIFNQRANDLFVFSVLDMVSGKLEIDKHIGFYEATLYIKNTLVLLNNNQALFIKGSRLQVFKIGFKVSQGMLAFGNGILFLGQKDVVYYNFDSDKTSVIIKNQSYDADFIRSSIMRESGYFLTSIYENNSIGKWAYWTLGEKQLNYFDGQLQWIPAKAATGLVSADTENSMWYWHFNGIRFIKAYPLSQISPSHLFHANDQIFATFKTPEKGYELYQLGIDSLVAYPEIVKGNEGIEAKALFEFRSQIYLYGFTYTHGWQVWKMSKPKAIAIEPQAPLANEPVVEEPVIYPNPAQDQLYINTDKSLPYKLINTRGHLLMQGNLSSQEGINMKSLPQGIYLIQLLDGSKAYVLKIVKE